MPPRTDAQTHESHSISVWYGKLRRRQVKPNPKDENLWEQVMYKPHKHSRRASTPHPRHSIYMIKRPF